jgi:alpha-galactosidase
LGFTGSGSVRDLWSHSELGSFTGSFGATVPSHGSRLLRVTPGQVSAAALVNAASARCLDDPGASTGNGTGLIVWDCNGAANQQWTATTSQLLMVLGKCLQARDNQTTPGTAVEIWDCSGAPSQQWRLNTDGTITGTQSGLCLDATGTANNTPIRLWTCAGAATQIWTRR